ncbi:MAG TPA: TlpA family protein disulfide reductase [Deltaproteobacteria bacterium]|nr:TlpA family protein disulfide reductase [Deltaproteobacteria bacterium]
MSRTRRAAAAFFVAALILISGPGAGAAGADPWRELGVERMGPFKAPDFTLDDVDGATVTLSELRGKVVFLNFWATWCPPCKEEMPSMEALHRKFASRGLVVLAVNDYESRDKAASFVKKHGYTFRVPVDPSGKVSEAYRAMLLPTTFIIDRRGMVIGKATGARRWDGPEAFELFGELLKARGPHSGESP